VKGYELAAQLRQGAEEREAGGEGDAGEVDFQELSVAGTIGWTMKDRI
jgi:hypothetical protein